jgi:multidrug resistance efflux pump
LRWLDLRVRIIPALIFVGTWIAVALMWTRNGPSPIMLAEAEPVVSNVTCYKPGVLSELTVNRFQKVKTGDLIGQVMVTEPKILTASLAVIQADILMLQAEAQPVSNQQRTAMDYDHLQLVWMRQRADLAMAKANLQMADSEYKRMEALFKDQIVSQRVFEQAKAARDRLQNEVNELSILVGQAEANVALLQPTNAADITKVSVEPLRAAIAVQESKLRLTEAELSPLPLRAPMDGIVTMVYIRVGEAVTPGQPIVSVATLNPVRIIGYLRPPLITEPKVGMRVEVRTRGVHRAAGIGKVLEVGTQFENIPPTLLGPVKFANIDLGLPVDISLPPSLSIRPGELVDVCFAKE